MQYFTGISYYLARIRIIIVLIGFIFPACAFAADIRIISENPVQPVTYNDGQGNEQSVDFGKYKLTALHFWATWCQPCVLELPAVDAVQYKYAKENFKVIALSLDGRNIDNVKKFYSGNNIKNLDIMLDTNMDSFQKSGVKGLPTTIFINNKGHEVARADGPLDWESESVKKFMESRLK